MRGSVSIVPPVNEQCWTSKPAYRDQRHKSFIGMPKNAFSRIDSDSSASMPRPPDGPSSKDCRHNGSDNRDHDTGPCGHDGRIHNPPASTTKGRPMRTTVQQKHTDGTIATLLRMADRTVRAARLKTSHQPTVQRNKPLGCFRGHPRSLMPTGGDTYN